MAEEERMHLTIKQCTKLLPYDTSLYTVYGIFKEDAEVLDEIDFRNDDISKELKIYLDESYEVSSSVELIRHFVAAMEDTIILLFSDEHKDSFDLLHKIQDILSRQGTEALMIEPNENNAMPAWEIALLYNHTVSSSAHGGFGGGITSPAEYASLKDIVPQSLYEKYVLNSCVDSRGIGPFWTPYTPDQEEELEDANSIDGIEDDGLFNIEVTTDTSFHRKRKSRKKNIKEKNIDQTTERKP